MSGQPGGRLRSFTNHNRYKMMASMTASAGAQLGSSTSLSGSLSGSLQSLVDPAKLLSMQDDAHSRRISSEVMKQCLYESVVSSPYRRHQRRLSMRPQSTYDPSEGPSGSTTPGGYAPAPRRMVQSMPVTPAQSQTVTPSHSPTALRRFRAFVSRGGGGGVGNWGATPEEEEGGEGGMEVREDSWKGLASLFKPCPRYISASARNLTDDCGAAGGLDLGMGDGVGLGDKVVLGDRVGMGDKIAGKVEQGNGVGNGGAMGDGMRADFGRKKGLRKGCDIADGMDRGLRRGMNYGTGDAYGREWGAVNDPMEMGGGERVIKLDRPPKGHQRRTPSDSSS